MKIDIKYKFTPCFIKLPVYKLMVLYMRKCNIPRGVICIRLSALWNPSINHTLYNTHVTCIVHTLVWFPTMTLVQNGCMSRSPQRSETSRHSLLIIHNLHASVEKNNNKNNETTSYCSVPSQLSYMLKGRCHPCSDHSHMLCYTQTLTIRGGGGRAIYAFLFAISSGQRVYRPIVRYQFGIYMDVWFEECQKFIRC